MKLLLSLFTVILLSVSVIAQQPASTQTPLETARNYMRSGDFDNAIIVLKRALQGDAKNIDLQKELVMSYYYKRDYSNALDAVKVLLDNDDVDVVSYQIGGNVYKALENVKEADKL